MKTYKLIYKFIKNNDFIDSYLKFILLLLFLNSFLVIFVDNQITFDILVYSVCFTALIPLIILFLFLKKRSK